MTPSVPPIVLQHDEIEQQQLPQPQQPQGPMFLRNIPMQQQHPPVQHVDNFQDFLTHQSFLQLEHETSAGLFPAPRSSNQSAVINPTLFMSNGISMGQISQSSASSMNLAYSNHEVNQLPADQLANGLIQGASRELPSMHPHLGIRRNQNRQFAARLRARRQVHNARAQLAIANYGLHAQNWYLKTQLQKLIEYVQLLENIVADSCICRCQTTSSRTPEE